MRVAAPANAEFNSLCADWAATISVMLEAKLIGAG
jgi:hypothetical protein